MLCSLRYIFPCFYSLILCYCKWFLRFLFHDIITKVFIAHFYIFPNVKIIRVFSLFFISIYSPRSLSNELPAWIYFTNTLVNSAKLCTISIICSIFLSNFTSKAVLLQQMICCFDYKQLLIQTAFWNIFPVAVSKFLHPSMHLLPVIPKTV